MRSQILAGIIVAIAVAPPVRAQRLDDARSAARNNAAPELQRPSAVASTPADMPAMSKQIIGGVLGGAIGLLAGGYAGMRLEMAGGCRPYDDFCGFGGAIAGAALGEAIGVGTGVWLGGGRRGSGGAIPASFGGALLGIALAAGTGGVLLPAAPVVQMVSAIAADRKEASQNMRRR